VENFSKQMKLQIVSSQKNTSDKSCVKKWKNKLCIVNIIIEMESGKFNGVFLKQTNKVFNVISSKIWKKHKVSKLFLDYFLRDVQMVQKNSSSMIK
jgi:hypothetical protein